MFLNPILPNTSSYYTSQPTGNVNRVSGALDALEDTLDLSADGRNVLATLAELPPSSRSQYLENLAHLLKEGVVGTETLEINGRPYTSFASTRFADPRLAGARPYDR